MWVHGRNMSLEGMHKRLCLRWPSLTRTSEVDNMFCLRKWVSKASPPSRDWRVCRLHAPEGLELLGSVHHHSSPTSKPLRHKPNTGCVCDEWGRVAIRILFNVADLKILLKYFLRSRVWSQAHKHPLFTCLTLLPTNVGGFSTRSSRKMCKIGHRDIQILILLTL